MTQCCVDCSRSLIEINYTYRVHPQAQQFVIPRGQNRFYLSQDQQPLPGAKLQHDGDLCRDQCWSSPCDLQHWTKQIMAHRGRENSVDVADNLRSVTNRIFWEHQAVECIVLKSRPERLLIERAIDGEQTADTLQYETQSELDRREAFHEDQSDQRVAVPPRYHPGPQTHGLDPNLLGDLEVQRTAVLFLVLGES